MLTLAEAVASRPSIELSINKTTIVKNTIPTGDFRMQAKTAR